jgi:hypothetical protein
MTEDFRLERLDFRLLLLHSLDEYGRQTRIVDLLYSISICRYDFRNNVFHFLRDEPI